MDKILDVFELYADTDSLKLREGYNKDTIEEYNRQVKEKIERVSKELGIDFNKKITRKFISFF